MHRSLSPRFMEHTSMWIPRSPLPSDFCGRPGCPLCYWWSQGEGPNDVNVLQTVDQTIQVWAGMLLGTEQAAASPDLARKAADDFHSGVDANTPVAPFPPEPPAEEVEEDNQAWMSKLVRKKRPITCDEIADREERKVLYAKWEQEAAAQRRADMVAAAEEIKKRADARQAEAQKQADAMRQQMMEEMNRMRTKYIDDALKNPPKGGSTKSQEWWLPPGLQNPFI